MMKNIIKKTINISLVISLIALPLNVSAKTVKQYEDEAAKYAQELQEKKDKIAKNDAEVAEIKKNIASIESQITDAENQIKTLEAEIEKSNKEIENKKEQSKKIMKYFQIINSGNTYLEYIFEANSVTDMIYRISVVEQLTEYNQKVVNELNELIKTNNEKKEQLKSKQEELGNLKKQLESEKERIDADTAATKVGMPTLEEQIKAAKSNAAYYKNLGCGANEDIFACQYRKQQSSSSSSVPSAGTFSRPIEYGYVTRGVGGGHIGYDLGSSNKTIPIYPVADGQLYFAGYDNAGALIVIIRHNTGSGYLYSTYAHMSSFSGAVSGYVKSKRGTSESITNGPIINRNTTIGNMGSTGNSTGPHLHIEMATCSWHSQGGCLGYNAYLNRIVNPNRYITFPSRWTNR